MWFQKPSVVRQTQPNIHFFLILTIRSSFYHFQLTGPPDQKPVRVRCVLTVHTLLGYIVFKLKYWCDTVFADLLRTLWPNPFVDIMNSCDCMKVLILNNWWRYAAVNSPWRDWGKLYMLSFVFYRESGVVWGTCKLWKVYTEACCYNVVWIFQELGCLLWTYYVQRTKHLYLWVQLGCVDVG